ncbi:hypothetical protein OKW21_003791 [Catalinimonas alkaloidigena]|nr:hypothetical protein [Catalinimonas alkaloidigena]
MSLDNRLAAYPTEETTTGDFVVRCMEDFIQTIDRPTVVILDNAARGHLFIDAKLFMLG